MKYHHDKLTDIIRNPHRYFWKRNTDGSVIPEFVYCMKKANKANIENKANVSK